MSARKRKLILDLEIAGCKVSGRVLYMDESLRGTGDIVAVGDLSIRSDGRPELRLREFFLNGSVRAADGDSFSYEYSCTEAAAKVFKAIETGMDIINSQVKEEVLHMDKLKLEVYQYENVVLGKVLHMDESLRGTGTLAAIVGFKISSSTAPSIGSDSLFVRGSERSADDKVFFANFGTAFRAAEACIDIAKCVDIINSTPVESVPGSMIKVL